VSTLSSIIASMRLHKHVCFSYISMVLLLMMFLSPPQSERRGADGIDARACEWHLIYMIYIVSLHPVLVHCVVCTVIYIIGGWHLHNDAAADI